jgi:hypothetical protein
LCQRNGMLAHADAELSASSTLPRHDSLVEGMGSHPRSPVRIDTQRRREGPAKVGFATGQAANGLGGRALHATRMLKSATTAIGINSPFLCKPHIVRVMVSAPSLRVLR